MVLTDASGVQTLDFSFVATINGDTVTATNITFLQPSPCFGNSSNPAGVTITAQLTPTSTPGVSNLALVMQWTQASVGTNTLTLQGQVTTGVSLATGSGTYMLSGATPGCPTNDNGTFSLSASVSG